MRRSEERFRTLFESAPLGIVALDRDDALVVYQDTTAENGRAWNVHGNRVTADPFAFSGDRRVDRDAAALNVDTGSDPTIATDGAELYTTEHEKALQRYAGGELDAVGAAEIYGEHLLGASTSDLLECSTKDRERIFNLGYYTWVEQQGVSIEEFEERRNQSYWRGLRSLLPTWDEMIVEFNDRLRRCYPALAMCLSMIWMLWIRPSPTRQPP